MELLAGISLAAIEQWGYYVESQNPTDYRYWSIPFTSHYITMATKTYYEPKEEAVPWLVGIDMQKFICGYGANFIGSSYVSCVGIGCQPQWGTNTIGSRTTRTEAYPLPYSEFCLPIVSGKGYVGGLNYGFGVGVTNFGLTSVTIANNSEDSSYRWTGYTYIVVGAQPQWGENVGGGGQTVSLPISFEVAFTAVVSADSSWCNASCHITTTTITTMNYQSNKPDIAQLGPVQWLAIGIQPQWGNSASLSGYVAVCIFPISFTTTDYTAVATGVMSAADATFGKENYVNNILWDFTSESQVAFRLSHLDRPTLRYIAIGF